MTDGVGEHLAEKQPERRRGPGVVNSNVAGQSTCDVEHAAVRRRRRQRAVVPVQPRAQLAIVAHDVEDTASNRAIVARACAASTTLSGGSGGDASQ